MKLLRRLERMEAGAASRIADVGISWSAYDVELDRELAVGEYLAVDVVEESAGHGTAFWRCSERATVDPGDYGTVRDVGGAVIGRVTERSGGLITVEYGPAGEPPRVAIVKRHPRRREKR